MFICPAFVIARRGDDVDSEVFQVPTLSDPLIDLMRKKMDDVFSAKWRYEYADAMLKARDGK